MKPLDPRTIDRVAQIVCDVDGPHERAGWQLEKLLRLAGWADPPYYDHGPRVPWLVEEMTRRGAGSADVARLVCRVCDPLEYDDGPATSEIFREQVNRILEPEGLVVELVSGRPVLGTLGSDGRTATYTAPDDLAQRLARLVSDPRTAELLVRRVTETRTCEQHGAYTMAIIGIGSFVEGLLHAVLKEHGVEPANGRPLDRAGLHDLITLAKDRGWIQFDAADFAHTVREYRNFVHPRAQLERGAVFDADSVTLCWGPVAAIMNDLEEAFGLVAAAHV